MSQTDPPAQTAAVWPVSVLMERRIARSGRWSCPQWEVVAVVAGEEVVRESAPRMLVHEDEASRQYLWTGLQLELFKDGCESYWYNLMSEQPYLFVICHETDGEDGDEDEEELQPVFVTANQDEANAHMESDDPVFSVPMPEKVHQWVEHFVVAHYQPFIKKKRRRRDWAQDSDDAQKTRAQTRRLH